MGVLEIIAEDKLGTNELKAHPRLRAAMGRAEQSAQRPGLDDSAKAAITAIAELCFAYEREIDPEEKANILRTLEEISANEPLELPSGEIEQWEKDLSSGVPAFAQAKQKADERLKEFRKRYFSLRAKAGLQTQEEVASRAGLRRSYIAVIEAGEHFPQQKTLQKLAKAFGADVADLIP